VPWRRDSYRQEVLLPARRAGNVPPHDLYERYGLSPEISGRDAFRRHIDQVVEYWQELSNDRVLGPLAGRLLTAHYKMEREGSLTAVRLAQLHEQARRKLRDELSRQAEFVAGSATHVGPETVTKLIGALDGPVTRAEAIAALREAGVEVVDAFPALPAARHARETGLASYLVQVGRRLSAEIVFGDDVRRGFRVLGGFQLADGRRLDEAAVKKAQREADARPFADPATAPVQKALTILRKAAGTAGELDALVLSEIVDQLRQFMRKNRLYVQRSIAAHAMELGLADDEAGLLAAALLAEDSLDAVRQQVEEELDAGRLRAAQRLAAGLPEGDPLRARVTAVIARVAELSRRADGEMARGQSESAAELLAEALRLASDDDALASRLEAVPPPAPRAASARVDGQQILVTWEPSAARAGQVRYRVVRGQGRAPGSPAEGTAVIWEVGAPRVVDSEAPAGTELCYSVFADRGGEAWSRPAVAPPFVFAPDVASVAVTEAETSIAVSWRAHPAAESIHVVRREQGKEPQNAAEGTDVPASLAGFTDCGLRTGVEYAYRIKAIYRGSAGRRQQSDGITVSGVPTPEPDAVTDLDAQVPRDDAPATGTARIVLSWTPPRHGQVRLVRVGGPPSWPTGMRVPPGTAGMEVIPGELRPGPGGRAVLEVSLPFGDHYVLALTHSGRVAVAGNTATIRLVEPVSGLRAIRMHDKVELSWAWPSSATDAIVRYPGGEKHCSRRAYFDDGGVMVTVGRDPATFEVHAVYQGPNGRLAARAERASVPARAVAVRYRVLRRKLHPRRRVVKLFAEETVLLPPLVIVQTTGRHPPDDPSEGRRIDQAGPQHAVSGQPVEITVDLPDLNPGWLACFVDPQNADPGAASILLFPPPEDQMRIP
jgi:hypothetical protein